VAYRYYEVMYTHMVLNIYVCHEKEISRAYIIIIIILHVCVVYRYLQHIYAVRRPTSFPPADSENRIHVRNIMTVWFVVVVIILLLFRVIPDGTRRGSSQEALFVWRVVIVKTTAPVMNQTHHTRGG